MDEIDFAEKCRNKLDILMGGIEKEISSEKILKTSNGFLQYVAIIKPKLSESNYKFTCVNTPNGISAHMDLSGDM